MNIKTMGGMGLLFLIKLTPLFAQHQLQASFDDRVNQLTQEMKVDTKVQKNKKRIAQEERGLIRILKKSDDPHRLIQQGQLKEKDQAQADFVNDEASINPKDQALKEQALLLQDIDINCGIDDFEDNQTRSRGKNIILSDPNLQELQLFAKICPFDHDWFSLYIEQGEMLQIQLLIEASDWVKAQKSIRFKALEIFAPRARKAMKSQVKKEKNRQEGRKYILQELTFFAHRTGRYKFLIQALWQDNQEISYELRLKKKEKKRAPKEAILSKP
jgi:hypothetical protein